MLRRRLALYTLLYTAGIAAGFFMFERTRIPEAAGFCIAVIAAVMLTDNNSSGSMFYGMERTDDQEYSEKQLNIRKKKIKTQKAILIVMFLPVSCCFQSGPCHTARQSLTLRTAITSAEASYQ